MKLFGRLNKLKFHNVMITKNSTSVCTGKERESDGGLESLLFIINYYKKYTSTVNKTRLINSYYQCNSYEQLKNIASENNLISEVCNNITFLGIIKYNQPIILNISKSELTKHYVVCYDYNELNGFSIFDPINSFYIATDVGLQTMLTDSKYIAFVNFKISE